MNILSPYQFLKNRIEHNPEIAIVLGSGLGEFADIIKMQHEFEFSNIPGFYIPTVKGHNGKLIFGTIHGKQIVCAQGRFHLYEGLEIEKVVLPIHLFKKLGCKNIFITNSSGCLRKEWNIGGFMHISSLLDFTFQDSSKVLITKVNNSLDFNSIMQFSELNNIKIYDGRYSWSLGPSYETPSEIIKIRKYGGDAVGMSTFPEIKTALEIGLNVIGIACLTNYASGITNIPLTHHEVVSAADKSKLKFCNLIEYIIKNIKIKGS